MRNRTTLTRIAAASLALAFAALTAHAGDTMAVTVGKAYLGNGTVVENATVLVIDGKIVAVGPGIDIPDGATEYDRSESTLTPGLIDAYSTAGVTNEESWAEHASEVIPHLRTLDAWDLEHRDFGRLVRDGVTTIFLAGDPASVIGSKGAVVKTGRDLPNRVLVEEGEPMVSISVETWQRGESNRQPSGWQQSYLTRRPTTGMGNSWVIREAFYNAMRNEWGSDRDADPGPAQDTLVSVMEGETGLRVMTRRRHDIYTAIRLTREFGIEKFTLVEATEAYRIADDLAKYDVSVVLGPLFVQADGRWRRRAGESDSPNLASAATLRDADVTFALTASDVFRQDPLTTQAAIAVRYGLTRDEAVRATTSTPASLIGVADRVGTIAVGMDADFVIWSGEPFEPASRAETVVIDGRVVFER